MGMMEVPTPVMSQCRSKNNLSPENNISMNNDKSDGKVLVDRLIRSVGGVSVNETIVSYTQSESTMDAFLAGELNKMPLQERQQVFEEIHGAVGNQLTDETPEFIAERLQALHHQIQQIHPKIAYELAEQQNPEYVYDDVFRLTFLRADLFDPSKAARRLTTFFEARLALFGSELLTKNLTLQDLNDDDMEALKSGYFQLLPSRDTTGRVVFANVQGMFKRSYKLAWNMQRIYHYMHCVMAEDMDSQLHGHVYVMYQIGKFEYDPPPDIFKGGTALMTDGSPVRVCGVHMCLDHPVMKAISRVVLALCGQENRARYRLHEGSHSEALYKLMSFGIPVDLLPITAEGDVKKGNHFKWLAMRQAKEGSRQNTGLSQFASAKLQQSMDLRVDLPGRNDVLMGKGKPLQQHSGNVAMRALVDMYLPKYHACMKQTKVNYVRKVRTTIRESQKGRFLKKHPEGWWVMVSEDEIRDKISKVFTSASAKTKRTKQSVQHNDMMDTASAYNHQPKRSRRDEFLCFGAFHTISSDDKSFFDSLNLDQQDMLVLNPNDKSERLFG